MWLAERILRLVTPAAQASATVGDLVERRAVVWVAVLRIVAASVARQWISAPTQVVKAVGYSGLLMLRFGGVFIACLVFVGFIQQRGGMLVAVGWIIPVALVLAEFALSLPLRKHSASELGISRFANGTRLCILVIQTAGILISEFREFAYISAVLIVVGVLLPIQVGRLVARSAPGRELASGLAVLVTWCAIWTVRFAQNTNWSWVTWHPDPLLMPMLLIGIASARQGMLREQEASWRPRH